MRKRHGRFDRACARIRRPSPSNVAQEGLEHQQRPQRRAVVARSRLMCVDQMLQVVAVEPAGLGQARARAPPRAPARAAGRGTSGPAARRSPSSAGTGSRGAGAAPSPSSAGTCLPGRASSANDGKRGEPFDQRVVHQRLAHLQRVRHAGAVDLGVDVADQVGLEIEVLDQRQRIVGPRACGVAAEDLERAVAAELALCIAALNSCSRIGARRIETPTGSRLRPTFAPAPRRWSWRETCAAPSRPSGRAARAVPNSGRRRPSGNAARRRSSIRCSR